MAEAVIPIFPSDYAGRAASRVLPRDEPMRVEPWAVERSLLENAEYEDYTDIPLSTRWETLDNFLEEEELITRILGCVHVNRVVLLTGEPGTGKTTTALMTLRRCQAMDTHVVYYERPEDIDLKGDAFDKVLSAKNESLIVVDNFLGEASLDGYDRWKAFLNVLTETILHNRHPGARFLLVSRHDVFAEGSQTWGIDLGMLFGSHNTLTCNLEPGKVVLACYPELVEYFPDLRKDCTIGFPLCCAVQKIMATERSELEDLFQHPEKVLWEKLVDLMRGNKNIRAALGLLALADEPLPQVAFCRAVRVRADTRLNSRVIMECLAGSNLHEAEVLGCLHSFQGSLIQNVGDYYSFLNSTVKIMTFSALCEVNRTRLSRLSYVRSISLRYSKFTSHLFDTESVSTLLVTLVQKEAQSCFPDNSPYFTFRYMLSPHLMDFQEYKKVWMEMNPTHLKYLVANSDPQDCHFLFYAACSPDFLEHCISKLKFTQWELTQALVGCCFYGHNDSFVSILNSLDGRIQSSAITASLEELVEGAVWFAGKEEIKYSIFWDGVPFHQKDTLMTLASWRGNTTVVEELLRLNEPPPYDIEGNHRRTALMHFCFRGEGAMVESLLEWADMNKGDDFGNTALHYACMTEPGNFNICSSCSRVRCDIHRVNFLRHCLVCYSDVDKGNAIGVTPLMIACEREDGTAKSFWYQFLRERSDMRAKDAYSRHYLHFVCLNKNFRAITQLATSSPNIGCDTLVHTTPLGYALMTPECSEKFDALVVDGFRGLVLVSDVEAACRYSNPHCVMRLVEMCPNLYSLKCFESASKGANLAVLQWLARTEPDITTRKNILFLYCLPIVCLLGSTKCVRFCLQAKVRGRNATLALKRALRGTLWAGRRALAELLLGEGASFGVGNNTGAFLFDAIKSDSPAFLDWLLTKGRFDLDALNAENHTALMVACWGNKVRSVRWLMAHGANPALRSREGWTPLFMAAESGNVKLIKLLDLPRLDSKTTGGCTPLHIACSKGHLAAVRLLAKNKSKVLERGAGDCPTMWFAVQGGNPRIVHLCAEHYEDGLDCRMWCDLTPLMEASMLGKVDVVKWLLQKNINLWAVSDTGETCLHYAAAAKSASVVEFLCQKMQPRLHGRSKFRQTALLRALKEKNTEAARIIIEHSGDSTRGLALSDADGWTALHHACYLSDVSLVTQLCSVYSTIRIIKKNKAGETAAELAGYRDNVEIQHIISQFVNQDTQASERSTS